MVGLRSVPRGNVDRTRLPSLFALVSLQVFFSGDAIGGTHDPSTVKAKIGKHQRDTCNSLCESVECLSSFFFSWLLCPSVTFFVSLSLAVFFLSCQCFFLFSFLILA